MARMKYARAHSRKCIPKSVVNGSLVFTSSDDLVKSYLEAVWEIHSKNEIYQSTLNHLKYLSKTPLSQLKLGR